MAQRSTDAWMERVDWVVAVRGAGTGFGVLVLAGLLWTLLIQLGQPWAPLALWVGWPLGFVLAARRCGPAPSPVLTGAVAAFFAYTLTIPLIVMSRQPLVWGVIAATCLAGMLIGAATGWVVGQRAARSSS